MPEKTDPYATPATKVLGLYTLFLFTGRAYSLTQLTKLFRCSKQTVLRMIEQIQLRQEVTLETWTEGNRNWYQIKTPAKLPQVTLDIEAIQHLLLCRDIVWHLLPDKLRTEVKETIAHATVLLPDYDKRSVALTSLAQSRPKGTIDYSPFQDTLHILTTAMQQHRICRVSYQSVNSGDVKRFSVAPLKIIAYREGLYVICRYAKAFEAPGKEFYDPILAIHRINSVKMLDATFTQPDNGSIKIPTTFGFMPGKPFKVRVAIGPNAAAYVRERKWSKDQSIEPQKDGRVILDFTATSEPEVISWVLSFGPEAQLISPKELTHQMKKTLAAISKLY